MSFSNQIRPAIHNCGLSLCSLATESGLDEAKLKKFMQGGEGNTSMLDSLAKVVRLDVAMKGPRRALLKKHSR